MPLNDYAWIFTLRLASGGLTIAQRDAGDEYVYASHHMDG